MTEGLHWYRSLVFLQPGTEYGLEDEYHGNEDSRRSDRALRKQNYDLFSTDIRCFVVSGGLHIIHAADCGFIAWSRCLGYLELRLNSGSSCQNPSLIIHNVLFMVSRCGQRGEYRVSVWGSCRSDWPPPLYNSGSRPKGSTENIIEVWKASRLSYQRDPKSDIFLRKVPAKWCNLRRGMILWPMTGFWGGRRDRPAAVAIRFSTQHLQSNISTKPRYIINL